MNRDILIKVSAMLVLASTYVLVGCGSSDSGSGAGSTAPAVEKASGGETVVLDPPDSEGVDWPKVLLFCRGEDLYAVTEQFYITSGAGAGGGVSVVKNGCPDGLPS